MSKLPETSATGPSQRGARNQQVARAGEYFVAAELNKRRAFAVTFAGNMPRIDIIACNEDQSRTVHIQVKTKRGGRNWHSNIVGSQAMEPPEDETKFWVFVDLGGVDECTRFWIVPDWWIRDNIHKTHQAYLDRHGRARPENPESKHHSIDESRLKEWQDRWDILGIVDLHIVLSRCMPPALPVPFLCGGILHRRSRGGARRPTGLLDRIEAGGAVMPIVELNNEVSRHEASQC